MLHRALALIALLELALGCVTPLGASAEGVRAALLGLEARRLAQCLPDPLGIDLQGPRERLIYAWRSTATGLGARVVQIQGGSHAHRVWSGPRGAESLGFCAFRFTLEDGAVIGLEVVGRSAAGLEASAECTFSIRHCVEPPR